MGTSNCVQVEGIMKILNLSVNLPNKVVLKFGDMQITFMIDHTAECLILPNNAVYE